MNGVKWRKEGYFYLFNGCEKLVSFYLVESDFIWLQNSLKEKNNSLPLSLIANRLLSCAIL